MLAWLIAQLILTAVIVLLSVGVRPTRVALVAVIALVLVWGLHAILGTPPASPAVADLATRAAAALAPAG